ncbi:MAG: hypothetical protein E6G84_02895 [Alphaproteobacteria bacterium]|nr:MAG: hypothetical protein E6G84_02895 [Alphaproteobacteria bacterium]
MNSRISAASIIVAILGLGVVAAEAGPCTKQIAAFEQSVRASGKNPDAGPTARESLGAKLSRQPTRKSVKQAEEQAQETFDRALARAKAVDAQGKRAECMRALSKARSLFDLQ